MVIANFINQIRGGRDIPVLAITTLFLNEQDS